MNKIIDSCFKNLIRKIRVDSKTIGFIKRKQVGIEKQIVSYVKREHMVANRDLKSVHSYFAGSYGRGTEINTSDIDLIVALPIRVYKELRGIYACQSYWLNEVANAIKSRYTSAKINVDGQVVSVDFGKVKFEVLPAFLNKRKTPYQYIYADTNDGGVWRTTDPRKDVMACNELFRNVGIRYKEMCWLMRCWRDNCGVDIHGIIIDCYMYEVFSSLEYSELPEYDMLSLLFFEKLLASNEQMPVFVPGSKTEIQNNCHYREQAKVALEIVKYSINYQEFYESAIDYWQELFGKNFTF